MTNSESLGAESATEPTTKPESADLNMSAGAEMLIERMKTNPEDFKYGGKFYRVVGAIENDQLWVSKRDRRAMRDAYETLVTEAEFSEWVYGEIFNPKEEEVPAGFQLAYTQNLAQSLAQTKNAIAAQTLNGAFGNNALLGTNSLSVGAAGSTTALTVAGTSGQQLMTVNANAGNPAMTLGNTTLSESMLSQIKTKLGL